MIPIAPLLGAALTAFSLLPPGALNDADRAAVERGGLVVKILDTSDGSEVAAVVAMRVQCTAARALVELRDLGGRHQDQVVFESGRLGAKPTANDLRELSLEPHDLQTLPRCHAGDCALRLPAAAMDRFKREVDWSGPDRAQKAAALWRQLLAGYAADYAARGDAGLPLYEDNPRTTRVAEAIGTLRERFAAASELVPDLWRYLATFPQDRPPDVEESLYWVKEKFWRKPVLSLNHVVILDRSASGQPMVLAATKQIYANHFFDGALSLTAVVEDPAHGAYLSFVSRTRADIRPSGFNWIERLLVRHLVRERLEQQFTDLRARLATPAS